MNRADNMSPPQKLMLLLVQVRQNHIDYPSQIEWAHRLRWVKMLDRCDCSTAPVGLTTRLAGPNISIVQVHLLSSTMDAREK